MTPGDIPDIKAFIISTLSQRLGDSGLDGQSLPEDFDLRGRGVIDSLGFVQLIGKLETHFGCGIDLSDVPPEQLTNLGVLCRHIAALLKTRHRG